MVGIISGVFPANAVDAFIDNEPLRSLSILTPYTQKGGRCFSTSLQTIDQSNVLGVLVVCGTSLINTASLVDLPAHFMCNVGGRISFGLHPHSLYRFVIEAHTLELFGRLMLQIWNRPSHSKPFQSDTKPRQSCTASLRAHRMLWSLPADSYPPVYMFTASTPRMCSVFPSIFD